MSRTIKLNYTTYAIPETWDRKAVDAFVALAAQLKDVSTVFPDIERHSDVSQYDCETPYVGNPVCIMLDDATDAVYYQTRFNALKSANNAYEIKINIFESEKNSNV
jgi:hypothetical protein